MIHIQQERTDIKIVNFSKIRGSKCISGVPTCFKMVSFQLLIQVTSLLR